MAIGSGSSARRIGLWGYLQAQEAAKTGQGIVDAAQGNALAALGKGRDAIGVGRDQGLAALGSNYDRARTDLSSGFDKAYGELDVLDPWVEAGKSALGTYQGSLGLGGAANRDAAVSAYRTSPGYERRVAEATDAVARKASALGVLGSGNTMQAISDRANALADDDYGRWQGQVAGLSDRGQQAATTQGTTRTALQSQLGQGLANLGQAQGRDTASILSDAAGREAGLYGQEAGTYGQFAGLGLNNLWQGTQAGIGSMTQGAQNARDAVNSGWSLGLNALGSGLGLFGLGMGGGNTLGGNLLKGLGVGR